MLESVLYRAVASDEEKDPCPQQLLANNFVEMGGKVLGCLDGVVVELVVVAAAVAVAAVVVDKSAFLETNRRCSLLR